MTINHELMKQLIQTMLEKMGPPVPFHTAEDIPVFEWLLDQAIQNEKTADDDAPDG